MIRFFYNIDFQLLNPIKYQKWIENCINLYHFHLGELNYIFCNDSQLLSYNQKYLAHDTFTDVISFDYTKDKKISADIFISVERVKENAIVFETNFYKELQRIMIHGVLHCMGFTDKIQEQKQKMRSEEEKCIRLF